MFRPQPFKPQQNLTRKQICPQCKGSGQELHNTIWNFGWKPCVACKGTGQIEVPIIPKISRMRNSLGT